jgi:hypothetical protein
VRVKLSQVVIKGDGLTIDGYILTDKGRKFFNIRDITRAEGLEICARLRQDIDKARPDESQESKKNLPASVALCILSEVGV